MLCFQIKDRIVSQNYRFLVVTFQQNINWHVFCLVFFPMLDTFFDNLLFPLRLMFKLFWISWVLIFCFKTLIRGYWLLRRSSFSSISRRQSYVASFTIRIKAKYSASVEDKVTVACFFKYQLISPLLSIKMKPKVDFYLSLSLT